MKTIKGPAIFLAQFASDEPPFNSLNAIAGWAADMGYEGVQIPSWDARLIDLKKAAASKDYCDELKGVLGEKGLQVTELSTHLQGQLVAVHPAYDEAFDVFAAPEVQGNPRGSPAVGGRANDAGSQGLEELRSHGSRYIFGRPGMAVRLSVAAAPGWPGGDGLRRIGQALAADSRRVRCCRM